MVGVGLLDVLEEAPADAAANDKAEIEGGGNKDVKAVLCNVAVLDLAHVDATVRQAAAADAQHDHAPRAKDRAAD